MRREEARRLRESVACRKGRTRHARSRRRRVMIAKNEHANGKRLGFDLTENLARWSREGCFMHSINHAKLIDLADIAQLLLDKVGIRARQNNWKDYVVDPAQMDAIWPVYTEVASKFAFNGSYIFKKPNYAMKENTQFFTLDTFVSKSFESYKHFPKTDLLCERVDQWLADESLAAFLDKAAM